ncbi:succinate dehydrogenase cytochrome b560 subunit, mitochondrial-like [Xenia sp. Carnegie-2017]|uniref:succinate dehydrogenase cytochrome b560 subunit, mitochondrial-like n=1 Tax=Xenia sp. Carnegie-2017 TaxID=2897299 RepID=UPI001F0388A7|nr:succinate dehydrogenase cytochrome b560 subunit, mitochondrial-like [Xenia sp. Carnegie-2017]
MATTLARKYVASFRLSAVSLKFRSVAFPLKSTPALYCLGERNASQDFYAKNKRLRRPTSPHLLIYKFEAPSLLSISHRITGVIQSGALSLAAIGLMFAPENFEYYINYLHALELPYAVWMSAKMLLAWPFIYHFCNGIRHLVWDVTAKGLNKIGIFRTGNIILLSSFILTGLLVWFY